MPPRPAPMSTWSRGLLIRRGSPWRRCSTLSCSSAPGGTTGSGMLGRLASSSRSCAPAGVIGRWIVADGADVVHGIAPGWSEGPSLRRVEKGANPPRPLTAPNHDVRSRLGVFLAPAAAVDQPDSPDRDLVEQAYRHRQHDLADRIGGGYHGGDGDHAQD